MREQKSGLLYHHRWLVVTLLISILIRLVTFAPLHEDGYTSDEGEYIYLAREILSGSGFVDSNGNMSQRTPLYPHALGLLFAITGNGVMVAHIVGCILGMTVVGLVYFFVIRLLNNPEAANFSALVIALYPGAVIYAGLLQTETLYMVLLLLTFLFVYRLIDQPTPLDGVAIGLFAGLAALTRAVFFGFFPLLFIGVVVMQRWRGAISTRPLLWAVAVYALVLSPWTVRNYALFETLVPISSGGGSSLLTGNNPYATGTWRTKPGFEQWFVEQANLHGVENPDGLDEVRRAALSRDISIDFIRREPLTVLGLALKKAFIHCVYPITNSDSNITLQAVAVAADIPLYSLAAFGLVATWEFRKRLLPVYAAIGFFTVTQIVLHAEARFRLPLVPLFGMFAGSGAVALLRPAQREQLLKSLGRRVSILLLLGAIAAAYITTAVLFITKKV